MSRYPPVVPSLVAGWLLCCSGTAAAPAPLAVAAARGEGDALLKAARAEDLFINETDDAAIVLRHRASGFRCVFNPGKPQNRVAVGRSLVRGEDVTCTTLTVTDLRELILMKAPGQTPEQQLALSIQEVRVGAPTAVPYTPRPDGQHGLVLPLGLEAPEPLTASLKGPDSGHRIVLGKVGDWLVVQRFHGPPQTADLGGVFDSFWVTTVLEPRVRRASAPPAAPPSSPPPPATPAEARAEADAIIARAGVADVFENVTVDAEPSLRHRATGFVCKFSARGDNSVVIYAAQRRNDDVGCMTRRDGYLVNYFVTRLARSATNEEAMTATLLGVRQAHPDAAPAGGTFGDASVNPRDAGRAVGLPVRRARLTYSENGAPVFSRAAVAVKGEWMLQQRLTAPLADATAADLVGELDMIEATDRLATGRPD